MLHKLIRNYAIYASLVLSCILLASCNDYHHGCHGCGNIPPTEFSNGVVAADLSGDGLADIVALSTLQSSASATPSNLKTYLATSAGVYASPVFAADGFNPLYVSSADLNGDGLVDVVTASYDDGALGVFFNDKTSPGTFNPASVLKSPGASQLAIADMNGDGLMDIVSADFNVSLFVQTSPGTFAAPIGLYAGGANWVALGDLNGDGAADVALTDSVGVKILMHTGAPSSTTFAAPVTVFTQSPNFNVVGGNITAIGDVDGDGLDDLVITDPGPTGGMTTGVYVLIQDPAAHGSFLAPVSYAIATQDRPQSIQLVDLQGTGRLDIVIGGQKFVTVLLHDPATPGKFLIASIHPARGANEIAIADVNGDGKLDIVVSNGVTFPMQGGISTTHPGVLLQSATTPGSFGTLQDLP
jgi:FG-GAP-like repeat